MKIFLFVSSGLAFFPSLLAYLGREPGAASGIIVGVLLFCTGAIVGAVESLAKAIKAARP